jgi:hypothetical protein
MLFCFPNFLYCRPQCYSFVKIFYIFRPHYYSFVQQYCVFRPQCYSFLQSFLIFRPQCYSFIQSFCNFSSEFNCLLQSFFIFRPQCFSFYPTFIFSPHCISVPGSRCYFEINLEGNRTTSLQLKQNDLPVARHSLDTGYIPQCSSRRRKRQHIHLTLCI